MMTIRPCFFLFSSLLFLCACQNQHRPNSAIEEAARRIKPILVTEQVPHDTDDPAIWYNAEDPSKSLILGTDKDDKGGLYVYDLEGRIIDDLVVKNLAYPNNVDVEYGLEFLSGETTDIAVTVERSTRKIRVFSVPDMKALDGGGFPAFESEEVDSLGAPMGIGIYKNPEDASISVIVSRKIGPTDGTYLWQYAIKGGAGESVSLELLRKFGHFSGGESEIEAILVDDALGFLYYSDEAFGIRKYYANPTKGNEELAVFGQNDFVEDREGIALWPTSESDGFIVVSNQQDSSFNLYPRNPDDNQYNLLHKWQLLTVGTDGCDLMAAYTSENLKNGFFIAMSEDRTFHVYDLDSLSIK